MEAEVKDREDARKFVGEVADAYNFRLIGMDNVDRAQELRDRCRTSARF